MIFRNSKKKRIIGNRRGVALEMAISTLMIVFALCTMMTTISMMSIKSSEKQSDYFTSSIHLEEFGDKFVAFSADKKNDPRNFKTDDAGFYSFVNLDGNDNAGYCLLYHDESLSTFSGKYYIVNSKGDYSFCAGISDSFPDNDPNSALRSVIYKYVDYLNNRSGEEDFSIGDPSSSEESEGMIWENITVSEMGPAYIFTLHKYRNGNLPVLQVRIAKDSDGNVVVLSWGRKR